MASQSSAPARSRSSNDAMAEWSIGAKIGKGSFASVYSGTHKVSAPWLYLLDHVFEYQMSEDQSLSLKRSQAGEMTLRLLAQTHVAIL